MSTDRSECCKGWTVAGAFWCPRVTPRQLPSDGAAAGWTAVGEVGHIDSVPCKPVTGVLPPSGAGSSPTRAH